MRHELKGHRYQRTPHTPPAAAGAAGYEGATKSQGSGEGRAPALHSYRVALHLRAQATHGSDQEKPGLTFLQVPWHGIHNVGSAVLILSDRSLDDIERGR